MSGLWYKCSLWWGSKLGRNFKMSALSCKWKVDGLNPEPVVEIWWEMWILELRKVLNPQLLLWSFWTAVYWWFCEVKKSVCRSGWCQKWSCPCSCSIFSTLFMAAQLYCWPNPRIITLKQHVLATFCSFQITSTPNMQINKRSGQEKWIL